MPTEDTEDTEDTEEEALGGWFQPKSGFGVFRVFRGQLVWQAGKDLRATEGPANFPGNLHREKSLTPAASSPTFLIPMSQYTLNVNGQSRTVDVAPETPLLWVLRDSLDLVGTKFGCGIGMCGACTVHLDGAPVRGCQTPISTVGAKRVTTIEGLSAAASHLLCRFLKKNPARHALPARIGVREKMADVLLADRPEHGIADGVHERVGIRMAVQALRVRNLDAAQDELAPGDQLMNVIANANMNHALMLERPPPATKIIPADV